MSNLPRAFLLALGLGMIASQPILADERWHDEPRYENRGREEPRYENRGREEPRYENRGHEEHLRGGYRPHGYFLGHWHEGRWLHEWHGGREGWWWVVEGNWYFYPVPVYPYPAPPTVVVTPLPQGQPGYYYYCPNPGGYYPQLQACATDWQLVPAAPAAPPPVYAPPPQSYAPPPSSGEISNTTGGTVLGAVGGAVAGAQFGHGTGKIAATALGTLLGAFVGHEVGASLDRADQMAEQQAEQSAFQAPLGQTVSWNNPDSGHTGTFTPVRDGTDQQGYYCREFQENVVINGQSQQAVGSACRQPDGTWQLINQR